MDVLRSLQNYLLENWPELVWIVVATAAAAYLAGKRNRTLWQRRSFLDRLNVSLTTIQDNTLKIRTILESDVRAIFLNSAATKTITRLANQTTESDPLIPVARDDCWYYLNAVLNEVSERFSLGFIRQDNDLPTTTANYLLCLTCERAGQVRTRKIRAMLIRKDTLENLPEQCPELEHPTHSTRWDTLTILAERWKLAPHYFLELELEL